MSNDQKDRLNEREIINYLFECMKYKLTDHELLYKTISKILKNNASDVDYKVYFTFIHPKYKNQIIEDYNYRIIKHEQLSKFGDTLL